MNRYAVTFLTELNCLGTSEVRRPDLEQARDAALEYSTQERWRWFSVAELPE